MSASGNSTTFQWTVQEKIDILEYLRRENVDSNEKGENGVTMLHLIFQNENLAEEDIMELLKISLDRGSDPNIKNNKGLTALHLAVARRCRSAVEFLVDRNAKIDETDSEGNSIAHFFVEDENEKFFKLLKLEGSHPKIFDSKKLYPFVDGFRRPENEVEEMEGESMIFAEWLIRKGFDFERGNKKGKSALHLCIEYRLEHILHAILRRCNQYLRNGGYGNALLHLFFEKNDQRKREYPDDLLRKHWSSYTSRYARGIVELIFDEKDFMVPIVLRDRTPLQTSSSSWDALVDHLLQICPQSDLASIVFLELMKSENWRDDSRLDYFFEILRSLIAKGADVNAKDRHGVSALYSALEWKNQRAVELLNEHGADFGALTNKRENLFHALAIDHDLYFEPGDDTQEALFDLVASKGCCDLHARTLVKEETPLHLAARKGNLAIVRKLLEPRSSECQERPLHLVSEYTKFLLESGADVNGKDRCGHRPLFSAAPSENTSVLPELLKWGAYVNDYGAGESSFFVAVQDGCSINAQEMLKYGADINDERIVYLLRKGSESLLQRSPAPSVQHRHFRRRRKQSIETEVKAIREKILLTHWMKLKAAGLACSMEYERFVECGEYQSVHEDCLKEIEKLKATLLDSNASIFTFLHMDFDRRRDYVNNENLKKIVDSPKLEERFPNYSVVILASYRETVRWKSLLEPAKRAWLQLTNVDLLDECIERIFGYLKNEDLIRMVEYNDNA